MVQVPKPFDTVFNYREIECFTTYLEIKKLQKEQIRECNILDAFFMKGYLIFGELLLKKVNAKSGKSGM